MCSGCQGASFFCSCLHKERPTVCKVIHHSGCASMQTASSERALGAPNGSHLADSLWGTHGQAQPHLLQGLWLLGAAVPALTPRLNVKSSLQAGPEARSAAGPRLGLD